jgi:hypothetical protein
MSTAPAAEQQLADCSGSAKITALKATQAHHGPGGGQAHGVGRARASWRAQGKRGQRAQRHHGRQHCVVALTDKPLSISPP